MTNQIYVSQRDFRLAARRNPAPSLPPRKGRLGEGARRGNKAVPAVRPSMDVDVSFHIAVTREILAWKIGSPGERRHSVTPPPLPPLPKGGRSTRAGLAPLELVLSLFFLLVMMALIINFGTIASWKVRGTIAARYAGWRTLSTRTGGAYPNPTNWQAPASMGRAPGMPLNANTVGQLWSQQDLQQPALRGPAVIDPATGNSIQLAPQQYMEMVNQTVIGSANLTKKMPLLPNLRKSYIQPLQPVLDHYWRYEDMSSNTNNWTARNNNDWRLYNWYLHEPRQSPDGNVQNAYQQYQVDDQQIQQNPGIPALMVLDRDPELYAWNGNYVDVYPSVGGCEILPVNVQMNSLPGLINQIQGRLGGGKGGVPQKLANAFLSMYQAQLQAAQQQQPPDVETISRLQPLVDQLTQFIATLF